MRLLLFTLSFGFIIPGFYPQASARANNFVPVRLRAGDNVISILRANGFDLAQREAVLRQSPGLNSILLTTDMSYFRHSENGMLSLKIHDLSTDRSYLLWRQGTKAAGARLHRADWQTRIERHEGPVRGALMPSLKARVPSDWVASRFMDAFILDHNLGQLPAGARFAFTVEKKFEDGVFVKYGEVLNAALTVNGRTVRREFIRLAGGGVLVNPRDLLSDRPFYAPVNYLRIASLFQKGRRHPILGRVRAHQGIDFELPTGAPVFAPQRGVVARRGRNAGAGNFLVLRHANGMETAYNHLSRIEGAMRPGTVVSTGQKIAEIGCTGYCTRPHLHFAVKSKGRMVDPSRYIKIFPSHYESSLFRRTAQN